VKLTDENSQDQEGAVIVTMTSSIQRGVVHLRRRGGGGAAVSLSAIRARNALHWLPAWP